MDGTNLNCINHDDIILHWAQCWGRASSSNSPAPLLMATFLVPEVELVEVVKKAAILPPIIKNHLTRLITLFLLIIANLAILKNWRNLIPFSKTKQ